MSASVTASAVRRFTRRTGKLLYRDAYRLTVLSGKAFDQFAQELGFDPA